MESRGLATLDHTFDSFDQSWKGTEKAYAAARALGEGTLDKPFLLLYGGTGNGKTHLIEATIIALGQRGIWARYWTAAEMAAFLKAGINVEMGHPNLNERIEHLCRAGTLVLDDLGVEKDTVWQWGNLEIIIDYRYRFRNITIVATNLDIKELEEKSERIVSRFSDREVAQLVLNKGEDYRPMKGRKR
jgi:DNA replication protein DnaC